MFRLFFKIRGGDCLTVRQVLRYVDAVMENTFKQTIKLRWINQVEGKLQVKVLQKSPAETITYKEENFDQEMIAEKPFDGMYSEYLFWQICLAQQEPELAESYRQSFERLWDEYVRHICRHNAG